MTLEERLNQYSLPVKQQRVVESILDDLDSNAFLSGQEICEKFDISYSSLTRLSKALNFNGFPEFKKELETRYQLESSPSSNAELFLEKSKNKSLKESINESEIRNIQKSFKYNCEDQLIRAAKSLISKERVFIIGIGQMKIPALKLKMTLSIFGIEAILFDELGFSKKAEVYSLTSKDMVINFSVNKELKELIDFLKILELKNVNSISFTDKKVGPLKNLSHYSFYCDSKGYGTLNSLSSYISMTSCFETVLFTLDKNRYLSRIKGIEENWNSLPIFLH